MNTSSRFVIAVHILVGLDIITEVRKLECVNSEMMAWSVNTNPVVIRRILSTLRKAGLVTSKPGPDGGSQLARHSEKITLLDVYQAVEDGSLFHFHYSEPNPQCPIGAHITSALKGVFGEAEVAMKNALARFTVQDVSAEIKSRVEESFPQCSNLPT